MTYKHRSLLAIIFTAFLLTFTIVFTGDSVSAATYQNFRHRTSSYDYLYSVGSSVYIDGDKPSSNSAVDEANWSIIYNGSYRLLKNSKTGRCLDSNTARKVYTNLCSTGNTWQNWAVLYNGDYVLFRNRQTTSVGVDIVLASIKT